MISSHLDSAPTTTDSPPGSLCSVLGSCRAEWLAEPPACFGDLNLDLVIDAILAGREEYDLRRFFYGPLLRDPDLVRYRHEVFGDLEHGPVRAAVQEFADGMRWARRRRALAARQRYRLEKQRWLLDAAGAYCDAVCALSGSLQTLGVRSRGLRAFGEHLGAYTSSERFLALAGETRAALDGLAAVRYTLRLKGLKVTVSTYEDEPDYSQQIEQAFDRFRQGEAGKHELRLADPGSMDHVEAQIAELVARQHPREFAALSSFCERHQEFVDETIARFDREVQIYLAVIEHNEQIARTGVSFCYPEVSEQSKDTAFQSAFDIALATKLATDGRAIVANDLELHGPERLLVVTGPNQGGKTTFARAFGQLHHLAGLGLPVPAARARVFLADAVHTHFERAEYISTLRGKLEDELVRMRKILDRATGDSVVVVNEIFASTTLDDAIYLGGEVLGRLLALGCLGVCVTFIDELASLGPETVSMVAGVKPEDPSQRTFEIKRRPADGRAYAWALAEKYGLSATALRERMRS